MNCICEIDTSLFSVALSDLPCLPHLLPSLDAEENVLYQNNIKYTWHQQWPISNVQGPLNIDPFLVLYILLHLLLIVLL